MRLRGWSAFGLPLPFALAPGIEAREWEEDGRFRFAVAASLPLAGGIVRYSGWLEPLPLPAPLSKQPPAKIGARHQPLSL
jgi:hypothetical protein